MVVVEGPTGATSRLAYGGWGCDGFENQGDVIALICIILWDFARPTGATSRLGYGGWGCDGFENQGD